MKRLIIILLLSFGINTITISQSLKTPLPSDTADVDLNISPTDNFFLFANGKWIENTEIPPAKTRWGCVDIIAEQSSKSLQSLTAYAAKNTGKSRALAMIGNFYTSGMDSLNAEKIGYQPIQKDLKRIEAITNIEGILQEIALQRILGITSPLFDFSILQDQKQTTKNIPQLSQGGTVLPDREYYLKKDKRSVAIQNEYLSYITDLFRFVGIDSLLAAKKATGIFELESTFAGVQLSKVDLKDPLKSYHKFSIDDFGKKLSTIPLRALIQQMGVTGQDSIVVNHPDFFITADSLLAALPLDVWKNYLTWYVLKSAAPYLNNAFIQRNFQYSRVLSGQKAITPRSQRISYYIDNRLGDLLGQLYVKKYFDPQAKKRMLALVNNLQAAFRERIRQLDWMSPTTKEKALIKLNAIVKKIGYPDKWKDYKDVVIVNNNLLQNMRSCAAWKYAAGLKKLGAPVDKTEWYFTPPTVNAYYDLVNNEIAFPAAILQPPFFDMKADDASNYGSIGAIIGHEMTHGFDDEGRLYDANGNLQDWWTSEDSTQFKLRADKMVAQFDSLTVLDTLHVNGKLTLGENIADLGGLSIAYDAFKKTTLGRSNKKTNGYTPDQRFFLSWAHAWRSKILPETAARLIVTDPHSPADIRANETLKNMDAFYKAFGVKPGDGMYRKEGERVRIW